MPVKKKDGALSNEDKKFILENMNVMLVEDIAEKLQKSQAVVEKVIKSQNNLPLAESSTVRWHLKHSLHWKHLKEEFTEIELNKIEDQYIKYVQQFREDVTATEEVQILNLIKIEILMDRNLKGKMKLSDRVQQNEKMIEVILAPVDGDVTKLLDRDFDAVMAIKKEITSALDAESHRTTEFVELQKQHNSLMEKVMGSRDQRVKEIINNKVSFMGIVKELLDRDKQEKDSRLLELGKIATQKEFIKLSSPHTFLDNTVDNPILSSEVVDRFQSQDEIKN